MTNKILPDDVEDPGRVFGTQPIGAGGAKEGMTAPTQSFSTLMQQPGATSPMANAGKSPMISPFALMQGQAPAAGAPNLATLTTQVNNAQSTLGDINNYLNTPNLKLKASTKYLLKGKMSEANDTLRAFNTKIGAETPPPPDPSMFKGPLGKFLGFVHDGQVQMQAAQTQLQATQEKGMNMSPSDFLQVQLKLNKAQQLLEFSSVLLSNAVSGIKQMMQIQL